MFDGVYTDLSSCLPQNKLMKQFMLLWQFLNQPLFTPTTFLNPAKFFHNYQIRQSLERCWMNDSVQLLKRCWYLQALLSHAE